MLLEPKTVELVVYVLLELEAVELVVCVVLDGFVELAVLLELEAVELLISVVFAGFVLLELYAVELLDCVFTGCVELVLVEFAGSVTFN